MGRRVSNPRVGNPFFYTFAKKRTMKTTSPFRKTVVNFILLALLLPLGTFAQDWSRYDIGFSGCSAYFPSGPEWDFSYSDDSSLVWVGEVLEGNIYVGVICVEFSEAFPYDASSDDLIYVTENYLDYLMDEFEIVSHTGYETGYELESNYEAIGISDHWEDSVGDPWAIRAWIDPYNMVVMYMYGSPDDDFSAYEDYFFNSFEFPGE